MLVSAVIVSDHHRRKRRLYLNWQLTNSNSYQLRIIYCHNLSSSILISWNNEENFRSIKKLVLKTKTWRPQWKRKRSSKLKWSRKMWLAKSIRPFWYAMNHLNRIVLSKWAKHCRLVVTMQVFSNMTILAWNSLNSSNFIIRSCMTFKSLMDMLQKTSHLLRQNFYRTSFNPKILGVKDELRWTLLLNDVSNHQWCLLFLKQRSHKTHNRSSTTLKSFNA